MQVQVGRGLLHAPLTLNARKARRVVVVNNDVTSLETLLNLKSNHSFREALQVNGTRSHPSKSQTVLPLSLQIYRNRATT